ncbi:MAG: CRISPR-associated helicase Cas3' [Nitrospirota bacterium]
MNPNKPIAHVTENGRLHLLDEHLQGTAKLAAQFAGEFGCAEWGRLAGLWHDIGKSSNDFQQMIRAASGLDAHLEAKARVDHSTAGALWAIEQLKVVGRILAYSIAGHHAGLPDWESDTTGRAALSQRLQNTLLLDAARKGDIPPDVLNHPMPVERPKQGADPALWIRLLFSCVVDADFLDTEDFFDPAKATARGNYPQLTDLMPRFVEHMQEKKIAATKTKVNQARAAVLSQCIAKAAQAPSIYTLTVPTGGGKTLSSLAFALHHAIKYHKHRIIYVIPYTSIIEPTADQFRSIFGDAVIEHHSNLDVDDEKKDNARSRLACENWDAPIVVTTSVQFFESLFASRTSRCRKLHNIVNSVVVLDEAQLLPPEFLKPILHVLRDLQKNYGVTLLLSTATQPALGPQPGFNFVGLPDTIEIMDDPLELHQQLRRVEISIPRDLQEPSSWDDLASELAQHASVLCIVNRRDDCRTLWEKMPEGTIHLSALMCGAHRADKIKEIGQRLKDDIPTRVISTQLVEAGVDVDFPVVYRALAGLDSVAQAAGRCNREGLREKGTVVVFTPPSTIPAGHLRQAAEIGRRLMAQYCADILAPSRFESFFKEFYWLQGSRLDKHGILADLQMSNDFRCSFRTAAMKFHLIDESRQAPVIVAYDKGGDLIKALESGKPDRRLLRKLQRYVVNLPRYLHSKLLTTGAIREIHPGIYVQGHGALYHKDLGFCADKSIIYEPDELVS